MLTPMSNASTLERPSFQALSVMGYTLSPLSSWHGGQTNGTFKIYVQDRESYLNEQPVMRYFAMGFIGGKRKPAFNFRFKTALERDQYVGKWAVEQQASEAAKITAKLKAKAERAALDARNEYKVGDVLHYSWGFDQTQCQFYKVVSIIGKATLEIIEICSTKVDQAANGMSCNLIPKPDEIFGEKLRVHVNKFGAVMDHGHAKKWDGKPKYCSWYA
jgi:hypothetical protein